MAFQLAEKYSASPNNTGGFQLFPYNAQVVREVIHSVKQLLRSSKVPRIIRDAHTCDVPGDTTLPAIPVVNPVWQDHGDFNGTLLLSTTIFRDKPQEQVRPLFLRFLGKQGQHGRNYHDEGKCRREDDRPGLEYRPGIACIAGTDR